MNAEIIKRLGESLRVPDPTTLIAEAVYKGLDDFVLEKVVDMYMRDRAAESVDWTEEMLIEQEHSK